MVAVEQTYLVASDQGRQGAARLRHNGSELVGRRPHQFAGEGGFNTVEFVAKAGQGDWQGVLTGLIGSVKALFAAANDLGKEIDDTGEEQGTGILLVAMASEQFIKLRSVEGELDGTLNHDTDRTLGGEAVEDGTQHGWFLRSLVVVSYSWVTSYCAQPPLPWKGWYG
jgi:hypothetical protein